MTGIVFHFIHTHRNLQSHQCIQHMA